MTIGHLFGSIIHELMVTGVFYFGIRVVEIFLVTQRKKREQIKYAASLAI